MTDRFAQVALPLPLASPYTYRIPETLGDRVFPAPGWWSRCAAAS